MLENICKWKNRKKGFTLVELIVVMVIMAILLAILVPSMTQWITKAKNRQVMVNARTVYLAAQSVVSEKYGTDPEFSSGSKEASGTYSSSDKKTNTDTGYAKSIEDLADLSKDYTFTVTWNDKGLIDKFTYYENGNEKNGVKLVSGVLSETDFSSQAASDSTK